MLKMPRSLSRALPHSFLRSLLPLLTLAVLTACGGGGTDETASASGTPGAGAGTKARLSGVAAIGAPIVNATVSVKDATGQVRTATTAGAGASSPGSFEMDVSTLTPPFILRVQRPTGEFLYSAAPGEGLANLNPLSTLILGRISARALAGTDPNGLFQGFPTFRSAITATAIDRVTATVYGELSPAFKAVLAQNGAEFNPIAGAFQVGDELDLSMDEVYIHYDTQSGLFQEKTVSQIALPAFGPLAPVTGSAVAGVYSGTGRVVSPETGALFTATAVIDNQGRLFMKMNTTQAVYATVGTFSATNTAALGGQVFTLTDGNHGFASTNASPLTVTSAATSSTGAGTLQLSLDTDNVSYLVTLEPDINATYGNNLQGTAKAFRSSKLGPFTFGSGWDMKFGSETVSTRMHLHDRRISSTENTTCRATNKWTTQLADLELSLYKLTLQETITDASATLVCPFTGTYDVESTAFFTKEGLLAFFQSKMPPGEQPDFVAVRLFSPN